MNIFLLGGWVARPSAFLFFALALVSCLILFDLVALLFVVALPFSVCLCCSWSPLFTLFHCQSLLIARVPVPSMPSISASLG